MDESIHSQESFTGSLPSKDRNAFVLVSKTNSGMAPFTCNRCGKCCVSLGPSIMIERQLNDRDYYCRSRIDNALFLAHVEGEFQEEIEDEFLATRSSPNIGEKKPCCFLQKSPSGAGFSCAIYATRPDVCRNFRCYHMQIRNQKGEVCGRVIGKNTLRTEDLDLQAIWNRQVIPVPIGNKPAWTRQVTAILADHGYRAEPVE